MSLTSCLLKLVCFCLLPPNPFCPSLPQSILQQLELELQEYLENYSVPDIILEEPEAEDLS